MSVQDIRMRLGRRVEASAAQAALSDREKVNLALRELRTSPIPMRRR